MFKFVGKLVIGFAITVTLLLSHSAIAQAQTNGVELGKAIAEVESLDAMRSGLAVTLEGSSEEPTMETFKKVCKPVGMKAKQISQENGWQLKQIANKYRNPAHAATNLQDKMALGKFEQNPDLIGFWRQEKDGTHYYRRIDVEASCLACHGGKDARPQFVKDKYPQDIAFDFKVGDLRGMYSLLIPASVQQNVEQALENNN